MGWGITIKNVFLSRVSKSQIPDKLEDAEDNIKEIRETILMLIAGKQCKKGVYATEKLRREVKDLLDSYEENIVERRLLLIANDDLRDVEDS